MSLDEPETISDDKKDVDLNGEYRADQEAVNDEPKKKEHKFLAVHL